MKILRTRLGQAGNVLLLALVGTAVIGIMLGAYLTLIKSQNQGVTRSQVWNSTIPLIEAGMEEAMTHLNGKGETNMLAEPGWYQVGSKYVLQRSVGDGYYNVCVYNYFPGGGTNQSPIIESRAFITPPVLVASANAGFTPVMATIEIPRTPSGMMGRGVRATAGMHSLFSKGLVAKGKIDLNGKNISTDSFDSLSSSNSTLGRYDSTKAKSNGDIATDWAVTNSVNVGNATIHGSVATGPNGTVSIGPGGSISGTITDDMNVAFDPVQVPFAGGGYQTAANRFNTNINGTVYSQVFDGGAYRISPVSQWSLSGLTKILITGDVSIWLPKGFAMSGSAQIEFGPDAKLTIYTGADSSIGGNGILNTADATKCMILGLPTCTSITMGGNAGFTGTIYAPNADVSASGGGSTDYDFQGASISKSVTLNGNFNFHYDEALRKRGPARGFVLTSWNEMNPDDVKNLTIPGT